MTGAVAVLRNLLVGIVAGLASRRGAWRANGLSARREAILELKRTDNCSMKLQLVNAVSDCSHYKGKSYKIGGVLSPSDTMGAARSRIASELVPD